MTDTRELACASADQRLQSRFNQYVSKPNGADGCWLWIGGKYQSGYGYFTVTNRQIAAHRCAFLMAYGAIPDGLFVCHDCPGGDNRACVNPNHLWLGTHKQNMADMTQKGRQAIGLRNGAYTKPDRVRKGTEHGRAKLTEGDVLAIRRKYATGTVTLKNLSAEYGVVFSIISRIVRYEIWAHLTEAKKAAANLAAKGE